MAVGVRKGIIEKMFTFDEGLIIGTASAVGVHLINSSDTGDTAFVQNVANGGVARGATAATDDNLLELSTDRLTLRAQDGEIGCEVRANLDAVLNEAFNIGFNDDALEDSNTLPVELATTTFTSNSTTFVGLVYDVDATNDDVHAFWVDDDSDTTIRIADLRMTGVAPVLAESFTAGVVLNDNGAGNQARATFNFETAGGLVGSGARHAEKKFASTVDRDAASCVYTGWENRSASIHTPDIYYIYYWKTVAA